MDVDFNPELQQVVPVSPIKFSDTLPQAVDIIPVVYIVNHVFEKMNVKQRTVLAGNIADFVKAKVLQAGKKDFKELQIDCDWTRTTKDNYFDFLEQLKLNPALRGKNISVTLRLHQVKNILSSGIPPVERAMLMCYNMGNLRKYGEQNSILDQREMNIYLKNDLEKYPLKLDVALPLFEWAVVFRNKKYAGISKRITKAQLENEELFKRISNSILYELKADYPEAGLKCRDIIRWEAVSKDDLLAASRFLSQYLKPHERNLVFYHLDANLLKYYTDEDFQKVIAVL